MGSLERLKEKNLPNKKHFYSSLSGLDINDENCKHWKRVFKKFKCKSKENYNNINLKLLSIIIYTLKVMYYYLQIYSHHTD